MHTDLRALEVVCKHYTAEHGTECLRQQKNKVRALQRRVAKLESENLILKHANRRWQLACAQWRESYANVSVHVQNLINVLRTQHWL